MFGKWFMQTVEAKHIRAQDFGWKSWKEESGKLWCRGENNIVKDFKEPGCEDVDLLYLAQDSQIWPVLVKTKFNSIKRGKFLEYVKDY